MTFRPKHAEDISYVYLLHQIFDSASYLYPKEISKRRLPVYMELFVCISSSFIDKND